MLSLMLNVTGFGKPYSNLFATGFLLTKQVFFKRVTFDQTCVIVRGAVFLP